MAYSTLNCFQSYKMLSCSSLLLLKMKLMKKQANDHPANIMTEIKLCAPTFDL